MRERSLSPVWCAEGVCWGRGLFPSAGWQAALGSGLRSHWWARLSLPWGCCDAVGGAASCSLCTCQWVTRTEADLESAGLLCQRLLNLWGQGSF